jgi:Glycosyl hydrolase family 92 N-terminal domain
LRTIEQGLLARRIPIAVGSDYTRETWRMQARHFTSESMMEPAMLRHLCAILFSACILASAGLATQAAPPPWPKLDQPGELGRWVNPLVGTGGLSYVCGNNFPGATVPFGMVRLSPDTV